MTRWRSSRPVRSTTTMRITYLITQCLPKPHARPALFRFKESKKRRLNHEYIPTLKLATQTKPTKKGFVKLWLRANLDRYQRPTWDIVLVFLLIIGEAVATVFAGINWGKDGWSVGTGDFAVFVGTAALMAYAVGAIIRGHLPFIKPSVHEQRRRHASRVLGVRIPYRGDTRADKPWPIVLGNSTKDDVLQFVGQLYSHDLLDNGAVLHNLSMCLHPSLWEQVKEAVNLLHSNRPQVILTHYGNFHPSVAKTLHGEGEGHPQIVITTSEFITWRSSLWW